MSRIMTLFIFLNKIWGCKSIVKYKFKTPAFFEVHFMTCMIPYGDPEEAFHMFSGE